MRDLGQASTRFRSTSGWLKNGAVLAAVTALLTSLWSSSGRAQTARYSIADLGTLGGTRSVALSVNDVNQVVGFSSTAEAKTVGFFYDAGSMKSLGTLGGSDSFAYAVSNTGLIAGRAQNAAGEFHACVSFQGGALIDLTTLSALFEGPFSAATAVSGTGLVVGYQLTATEHMAGRSRTFLFSDSIITDLGTFGGQDAVLAAINDVGQFAGFYSTESQADYASRRAFLGRLGSTAVDLGTLGGRLTTPTAINQNGQVVGFAQLPRGQSHAFLYTAGKLVDLGTLPGGRQSFAYGMNDVGQVVGTSESGDRSLHAVLYSGAAIIDLNTLVPAGSGWVLTEARDINTAGVIAGTGIIGGRQHAFLLTPL